MPLLLCRNRVVAFEPWRDLFVSHRRAHVRAGLHLLGLWPEIEDRSNVHFLFRVDDVVAAQAFLADPNAEQTGAAAGVIEGEYQFLEEGEGYGCP